VLAPAAAASIWTVSLVIELALVAALSLFCVVTFSQLLPAAGFVAAFYLLARSIDGMRLMSTHPISGADTPSQQVMTALIETLGYLLPALDHWTATTWLVDVAPEPSVLAGIALQGFIYLALLTCAALFDFHRRGL
jgi:hypothetical protein